MKIFSRKMKGMTIIEMLVAIGIFSMGIAGFSALFVTSWNTNSYIYETGQDSFQASRGVNLLVNDIRRARQAENGDYAIKSADDDDLVIYIDIDNDNRAEKVHYYFDDNTNEIIQGISEPSGSNPPTYSSGDDTTTVLATHIVNEIDDPVFSYFSNNYLADNTPITTPVDSGDIGTIRLVKVNLMVDIRPYHSPDHVTIESFTQLRNLKDNEE